MILFLQGLPEWLLGVLLSPSALACRAAAKRRSVFFFSFFDLHSSLRCSRFTPCGSLSHSCASLNLSRPSKIPAAVAGRHAAAVAAAALEKGQVVRFLDRHCPWLALECGVDLHSDVVCARA